MIEVIEVISFRSILTNELRCGEEKISELSMKVASIASEFDRIYEVIKMSLTRKKYDPNEIRRILMCVDEAFSNAVKCGNGNKYINVKYYAGKKLFAVCIQGERKVIDVKKVSSNTGLRDYSTANTRSIFLICRLMDKIIFNKAGNCIFMLKYNNSKK